MTISYPHCDARILHAPGECEPCDCHPAWQRERLETGVCFTGHDHWWMVEHYPMRPHRVWKPCPADEARPPETDRDHRRWFGNRRHKNAK